VEQTGKNPAEVRSWLEGIRRSAEPGSSFSLGAEVSLLYGRWPGTSLRDERGLIEYALRFVNGDAELAASEFLQRLPDLPEYDNFRALRAAEAEKVKLQRGLLVPLLASVISEDSKGAAAHFLPGVEDLLTRVWVCPCAAPSALTCASSAWLLSVYRAGPAFA
jgi:hypothetical protein